MYLVGLHQDRNRRQSHVARIPRARRFPLFTTIGAEGGGDTVSVKAIAKVWDRSRAKGSNLLVLLAIADYAHDDGRDAWPRYDTLAVKSRMTERAVRLILYRLQDDGEIIIEPNDTGRAVASGHVPKAFFHIRCVFDPENFSQGGKTFHTADPEKISQKVNESDEIPENFSLESEQTGTANKVDPLVDPRTDPKSGSAHADIIARYVLKWEGLYHEKPIIHGNTIGPNVARVLKAMGWEKLTAALDGYFATNEPYVLTAKHPFGLFLKNPAPYLVDAKTPTPKTANDTRTAIRDANVDHVAKGGICRR